MDPLNRDKTDLLKETNVTQLYDDIGYENSIIRDRDDNEQADCKKRASSATKPEKKKRMKSEINVDLISNLAESVLRDRPNQRQQNKDKSIAKNPPLNISSLATDLKDHSFSMLHSRMR